MTDTLNYARSLVITYAVTERLITFREARQYLNNWDYKADNVLAKAMQVITRMSPDIQEAYDNLDEKQKKLLKMYVTNPPHNFQANDNGSFFYANDREQVTLTKAQQLPKSVFVRPLTVLHPVWFSVVSVATGTASEVLTLAQRNGRSQAAHNCYDHNSNPYRAGTVRHREWREEFDRVRAARND